VRVQGYDGFHAEGLYLLDVPVEMAAGFEVDDQSVGAGFFKCFGIAFGFFDHEVDIADLGGSLSYLLDDRESETDIGNEPPIHDIEVQPVGFAFIDHFAFIFQPKKIGGQQRGRYDGHK
jgi:hypothetical protein